MLVRTPGQLPLDSLQLVQVVGRRYVYTRTGQDGLAAYLMPLRQAVCLSMVAHGGLYEAGLALLVAQHNRGVYVVKALCLPEVPALLSAR